jgi:hypothetical protein
MLTPQLLKIKAQILDLEQELAGWSQCQAHMAQAKRHSLTAHIRALQSFALDILKDQEIDHVS